MAPPAILLLSSSTPSETPIRQSQKHIKITGLDNHNLGTHSMGSTASNKYSGRLGVVLSNSSLHPGNRARRGQSGNPGSVASLFTYHIGAFTVDDLPNGNLKRRSRQLIEAILRRVPLPGLGRRATGGAVPLPVRR